MATKLWVSALYEVMIYEQDYRTDCISQSANNLGKGMDPILSSAIGKW